MGLFSRHRHSGDNESDPVSALRIDDQYLPVEVKKHIKRRIAILPHDATLSHCSNPTATPCRPGGRVAQPGSRTNSAAGCQATIAPGSVAGLPGASVDSRQETRFERATNSLAGCQSFVEDLACLSGFLGTPGSPGRKASTGRSKRGKREVR
jgi:hypothetical protein